MLLLVLYYVATPGVFQGKASGDGWFGFQYLRAIVRFGTLDMQKAVPEFVPFFGVSGPGHHMPNRCPFGPVFVWMPLYLVGLGLQGLAQLMKLASDGHGQSPFETWVAGLGTLAGVLVGWRYTYVLVARRCGAVAARIGSIAAVWATPIAWYTVTQPFYQHGLAFLFVAVLLERWEATLGSPAWRRMLLLGVIGGVGMMMRPQEALWLLLPGGEALWHVVRGPERRRWLVGGLVLSAAALLAFSPQMLVWSYYTGSPLQPAQVEPLRLSTPFFVVSLFSTRGGLFAWSPIFYAGLLGLCFCRRARGVTLALLAVFALEVYVVSSAWVVSGGYGYGGRRLSDGVVLLALGVGLLWARAAEARTPWPRRLVAAFVALTVVLNVASMELLRARKIASSGAYARSAQRYLSDVGLPRLGRLFGRIGYPFVQPAGWLFALQYDVPASTFEGVVGNWFLDRDGQWFQVQSHGMPLSLDARAFVISGLELAAKPPARVTGPVRLLLPMFAAEPIVVHFSGAVPPGPRSASWNGVPVQVFEDGRGLRLAVPGAAVRAGVNDLRLTLPEGATLDKIDFDSTTEWWLSRSRTPQPRR